MTGPSSLYVQLPILAAVATAAIYATVLQTRQLSPRRLPVDEDTTENNNSNKDISDDQSNGCNEVKYVTIGTVTTEMSLDDDDKTSNEDDIQSEWTASPCSVASINLLNDSAILKSTVKDNDVLDAKVDKSDSLHSKRNSRLPVIVMILLAVLACSVQVVLMSSTISKKPFVVKIIYTMPLCNNEFHDWVGKKSLGRINIRNILESTAICQTKNKNDDTILQSKTTTRGGGTKRFIHQVLGGVQLSMNE